MAFATIQETVSQTAFFSPKNNKHGQHQEGYFRAYYLDNREKILAYSQECYQVKKLVAPYLNNETKTSTNKHRKGYYQQYENNPERKKYKRQWIAQKRAQLKNNFGVKVLSTKIFSQARINKHSQEAKEVFFFRGSGKEEILRCLDAKKIRLATKNKIAQKKYWNKPWFEEWLSISALKRKYGEYGLLGGKQIGRKYLAFLDLDINKADLEPWRITQLFKNVRLLLNYLGCFHVETKKGFHVYLLTEELLPNQILYHVDSWLKKEKIIGSIQSKGKYVVGFDSPNKKLIEKGKWFWHVKDLAEVKSALQQFFFLVGRQEKTEDDYLVKLQQKISLKKQNVDNTFNTKRTCSEQLLKLEKNPEQAKKSLIQAKILSKHKTPLPHLWKAFYLDQKTQTTGYFLVNDYQKSYALPSLEIGSVRNMVLVNGFKHAFFSRMLA